MPDQDVTGTYRASNGVTVTIHEATHTTLNGLYAVTWVGAMGNTIGTGHLSRIEVVALLRRLKRIGD